MFLILRLPYETQNLKIFSIAARCFRVTMILGLIKTVLDLECREQKSPCVALEEHC